MCQSIGISYLSAKVEKLFHKHLPQRHISVKGYVLFSRSDLFLGVFYCLKTARESVITQRHREVTNTKTQKEKTTEYEKKNQRNQ